MVHFSSEFFQMFAEIFHDVFIGMLRLVHNFFDLLQVAERRNRRASATSLTSSFSTRFLRARLLQIVEKCSDGTTNSLEAFLLVFHCLRLYTTMMLILVCKMNTCNTTARVFISTRRHELHSWTLDLRDMTSANVWWHLIADLRLLYLLFLGIKNVTLTIFLFIWSKHAHHLIGYAFYAAWAATIGTTSLTGSRVRRIFLGSLVLHIRDI